jgi:hypothetical protein
MKTVRVKATVVYPVYIDEDMEVSDDIEMDDLESKILDRADQIFETSSIDPIIQDNATDLGE